MKFKIAVISLLTAILAVCLFTSYTLIDKATRQFELQKLQTRMEIETFEVENFKQTFFDTKQTIRSTYYYEWYDEYNKICGEE